MEYFSFYERRVVSTFFFMTKNLSIANLIKLDLAQKRQCIRPFSIEKSIRQMFQCLTIMMIGKTMGYHPISVDDYQS